MRDSVKLLLVLFLLSSDLGGGVEPQHVVDTTAIEIGDDLEARRLDEGIWVVTSLRPWAANSVVVRLDDGTVVLADTPPTRAYTRNLLAWVEGELDPNDPLGAFEARQGGRLRVLSTADGKTREEHELESPPVFNGIAVASGRLFVSLKNGQVACFGAAVP